jgi:PAS domain S-box-containing protein
MDTQTKPSYDELKAELDDARRQLEEANDTIDAIRTGQVDALLVEGDDGLQLYALKTADQTYRMFVEQMNEGAVTLNPDGLILYCNSSFATIVQSSASRITGQILSDFVRPADQESCTALLSPGWSEDAKAELYLTNNAGIVVPCQLSVSALTMDQNKLLSVIVTDLSAQKETQAALTSRASQLAAANAALEQSNYDLLQFASVASHDLQEPLRKIMVFSDMLSRTLPADQSAGTAPILEKITASSRRMKALTADILAYSQLAKDNMELSVVCLDEVLAEILDDYELMIADKAAQITLQGMLPGVYGNRGQMRQVFQNLLSNALKFSRADVAPEITITSISDDARRTCTIRIADNGIGFETKYSERIFGLFQRLNTKDKFEGTGIGLAITKKIVDKHGGQISVISEEGIGTTFSITLPCLPAQN